MIPSNLSGRKVLVVEDEVLIGLVLEDVLDMLGCVLAGNATTLEDGRRLANEVAFDVAILDVNLGSDPVFPLADDILARGIPVIFATGALADTLPDRFRGCPVLEKPYAFPGVEAALQRALPVSSAVSAAR